MLRECEVGCRHATLVRNTKKPPGPPPTKGCRFSGQWHPEGRACLAGGALVQLLRRLFGSQPPGELQRPLRGACSTNRPWHGTYLSNYMYFPTTVWIHLHTYMGTYIHGLRWVLDHTTRITTAHSLPSHLEQFNFLQHKLYIHNFPCRGCNSTRHQNIH